VSTEDVGVPSGGGSPYDTISYAYDNGDRLTSVDDALHGTETNQYNILDDLTSQATAQGTLGYSYNNDGDRLTMTAPGLPPTSYIYDNDNNLKTITQGASSVGFTYNQDNETTAIALPDGDAENFTQDADGDVTAETVKHGSKSLGTLDYTYDPDGSETAVSGKLPDATLPAAVSTSTYNVDDEATTFNGASLTYDNDGDLMSDSGTGQSFNWNQLGELSSVTGGSTPSTFSYDPSGRRATATFRGTTNTYLYDGDNLIEDTQGSDPTTYLTGGGDGATFQVSDSSGSSSLVTDPVGSTVALAGSSGALSTDYAYSPSGVTTIAGAASSNTIESVGQQADPTGVEYSAAGDYYSSVLQQSLSGRALLSSSGGSGSGGSGSWTCTNCSDGGGGGDGGGGDPADPKAPSDGTPPDDDGGDGGGGWGTGYGWGSDDSLGWGNGYGWGSDDSPGSDPVDGAPILVALAPNWQWVSKGDGSGKQYVDLNHPDERPCTQTGCDYQLPSKKKQTPKPSTVPTPHPCHECSYSGV
jgi:hypothetical protein